MTSASTVYEAMAETRLLAEEKRAVRCDPLRSGTVSPSRRARGGPGRGSDRGGAPAPVAADEPQTPARGAPVDPAGRDDPGARLAPHGGEDLPRQRVRRLILAHHAEQRRSGGVLAHRRCRFGREHDGRGSAARTDGGRDAERVE